VAPFARRLRIGQACREVEVSVRSRSSRGVPTAAPHDDGRGGDLARRRAWWSLAFYPVSLVAAFVIGEGIYSWLGGDEEGSAVWVVLVAAIPALVVFALPGIAAVVLGRQAMRLGRPDGRVPAIVGAAIAIGFAGLNLLSYVVQLMVS